MLEMTILTSVWGAQHPNSGQNIQHICQLDFGDRGKIVLAIGIVTLSKWRQLQKRLNISAGS